MPAAYTDLFNTALDDLADFLGTVLDLVVVTDARNVAPPCVVISPCSFEAFNDKVADLTFPVQIITLGPANLDAQRSLLNLASQVLGKGVAVTSGRPTAIEYGNGVYPAYELTVKITTKTSA